MLGGVGTGTLRTNPIIHHGITNILSQAAKLVHIFGAVQEPRRPASLFQWDEILENFIQFPSKSCTSGQPSTLESVELPFEGLPPFFLFDFTFRDRRTQQFRQPSNPGHQ